MKFSSLASFIKDFDTVFIPLNAISSLIKINESDSWAFGQHLLINNRKFVIACKYQMHLVILFVFKFMLFESLQSFLKFSENLSAQLMVLI